ncbi:MAG: hypothetical protein WBP41_07520 [Saprospiraceae bacterium]
MIMTTSCERTEIQKSTVKDDGRIIPRTGFCDNCAEDDCCCYVELQQPNSSSASLRLCGTADGLGSCTGTPPNSCASFSGGGKVASLSTMNPKQGFCMVKGNAFYIQNVGGSSAVIKISCQDDLTSPQIIYVTIPAAGLYYYGTNNACEIAECE